jgi:hypothetical protein
MESTIKRAVLMEFRIPVCANNIIMFKIKSKGAKLNRGFEIQVDSMISESDT